MFKSDLPAVAALDTLASRYGWSYDDYLATPEEVVQRQLVYIAAQNRVQAWQSTNAERRAQGLAPLLFGERTGDPGAAAPPVDLAAAAAAGMPVPSEMYAQQAAYARGASE